MIILHAPRLFHTCGAGFDSHLEHFVALHYATRNSSVAAPTALFLGAFWCSASDTLNCSRDQGTHKGQHKNQINDMREMLCKRFNDCGFAPGRHRQEQD